MRKTADGRKLYPRTAVQKFMKKPTKKTAAKDLPPSKWPLRKGRRVWYISSGMTLGGGTIESGWVQHYNPAREDSWLTVKGQPVYTIGGPTNSVRGPEIVGAEHVRAFGNPGRLELVLILIDHWKKIVGQRQDALNAARAVVDAYCEEARKLAPRKAGRKRT